MVVRVPYRSLGIFGALSVGDYLIWNWSVAGNHDAVAIISGLSLPVLLVVLVLLAIRNLLSLLNGSTSTRRRPLDAESQHTSLNRSVEDGTLTARPAGEVSQPHTSTSRRGKVAA
jgi:hypothetical protein